MSTLLVLVHLLTLAWECSIEEFFFLGTYHADFRGHSCSTPTLRWIEGWLWWLISHDLRITNSMPWWSPIPKSDSAFKILGFPWILMDYQSFGFSDLQRYVKFKSGELWLKREGGDNFWIPVPWKPKSDWLEVLMKTCQKIRCFLHIEFTLELHNL